QLHRFHFELPRVRFLLFGHRVLPCLLEESTLRLPTPSNRGKIRLRTDEYSRMLSEAGGNPRDFAILQLFLQTGIRVSELIAITFIDLDLQNRVLKVHGKGNKE